MAAGDLALLRLDLFEEAIGVWAAVDIGHYY